MGLEFFFTEIDQNSFEIIWCELSLLDSSTPRFSFWPWWHEFNHKYLNRFYQQPVTSMSTMNQTMWWDSIEPLSAMDACRNCLPQGALKCRLFGDFTSGYISMRLNTLLYCCPPFIFQKISVINPFLKIFMRATAWPRDPCLTRFCLWKVCAPSSKHFNWINAAREKEIRT